MKHKSIESHGVLYQLMTALLASMPDLCRDVRAFANDITAPKVNPYLTVELDQEGEQLPGPGRSFARIRNPAIPQEGGNHTWLVLHNAIWGPEHSLGPEDAYSGKQILDAAGVPTVHIHQHTGLLSDFTQIQVQAATEGEMPKGYDFNGGTDFYQPELRRADNNTTRIGTEMQKWKGAAEWFAQLGGEFFYLFKIVLVDETPQRPVVKPVSGKVTPHGQLVGSLLLPFTVIPE
jgi:hypothetical protein